MSVPVTVAVLTSNVLLSNHATLARPDYRETQHKQERKSSRSDYFTYCEGKVEGKSMYNEHQTEKQRKPTPAN